MDFASGYFGKSIKDINYQDIVSFFTEPRKESDKIEFKSFQTTHGNLNKSFDGIIRGICAFLNSEGGILIFGAPEGVIPHEGNEKIYHGNLTPVNEHLEQDRIINKISDSITPLPVGVKIAILNDGSKYVYVFEVQQSDYSPHQFKDVYYARLDGQTKPAPHYLIEALFRKVKFPNIEGYIKFEKIKDDGILYILDLTILIGNFTPLQNEENVSFRLMCSHGVFENRLTHPDTHKYADGNRTLIVEKAIDILHYGDNYLFQERLSFNPNSVLSDNNVENCLILSFGGRYSPAKTSIYKLDFKKINCSQPTNLAPLLSFCEENKLYSERQAMLGSTKEKVLNEFLGRKINDSNINLTI